jgi:hypothetical protein
MNCELCERRLLASPDPDDLPAEVALHLAECPACRDRQRRLLEIEAQVPLLPVPVSYAKGRFLQRILNEQLPVEAPATVPLRRRRGHRVALVLGGMAAAVAVTVGLVLSGVFSRSRQGNGADAQAQGSGKTPGPQPPGAPSPQPSFVTEALVAKLVDFDVRLAQAESPGLRFQALAEMADAVGDEAKVRVSAPEALQILVQLYENAVLRGIIPRAKEVSRERPKLLGSTATQLAKTGREVEALAQKAPPAAAKHLQRVAILARHGSDELRALLQEAPP